jgi:hypothetical protein
MIFDINGPSTPAIIQQINASRAAPECPTKVIPKYSREKADKMYYQRTKMLPRKISFLRGACHPLLCSELLV